MGNWEELLKELSESDYRHGGFFKAALDEITTLRQRVAELEILLAEAYADSDEVLRPRVAELEGELLSAAMESTITAQVKKLTAERDDLLESNRIACKDIVEFHNRVVELKQQRDDLLAALEKMNRAYVNLMENVRDRIIQLGGDCDPVEVMESDDPHLRESRASIASVKGGAA